MSKFVRRSESPSYGDRYFLHTSAGGLNECILIDNGSCLPNCVGYCWGRWYELLGKRPRLSMNNAENWWGYTADGYERGQTPKLGAVICWRKGRAGVSSDGAGHVAIVEKIGSNGDILVSESHYGGARWKEKIYTRASGYYLGSAFTFQGFIYLPEDTTEVSAEPATQENQKKVYLKGDYRVTDASLLHVRTGPSTAYKKKTFKELTKNAQEQVYDCARYKANGYVMGVEFTVSKVSNNWGKTPSGWVCLDYCTKI